MIHREPDMDAGGPLFARKLVDTREGARRRDAGCERVLENAGDAWRADVYAAARSVAQRLPLLTIEDVRAECVLRGVAEPHHHNAWGACLRGCDFLERTDRVAPNTNPQAHARIVRVWRSLLCEGV